MPGIKIAVFRYLGKKDAIFKSGLTGSRAHTHKHIPPTRLACHTLTYAVCLEVSCVLPPCYSTDRGTTEFCMLSSDTLKDSAMMSDNSD